MTDHSSSAPTHSDTSPLIHWLENSNPHSASWRSENGSPPPKRVVLADDTLNADVAYRLACEGTALLWRGDYQNARQLLQALGRRIDKKPKKNKAATAPISAKDAFNLHRQAQAQRARVLGMLLLPLNMDYSIPLRRAPDVHAACVEAYGTTDSDAVVSLREILGLIGAHEWRKKGVDVPATGGRIHPYYGVFSPVRGEYIELVAQAPLPSKTLAFDIGTGTGVLAAVLAKRGVQHIVATDLNPRALDCASENMNRLGFAYQVEFQQTDLFPEGRAPLIVCNPPWLPARPNAAIEYALYDFNSLMLKGFLNGLRQHLTDDGEAWLILSDLAEHLGLRTREELLSWFTHAGASVIDRHDARPKHGKAFDRDDPLHQARSKEVTSLWRLSLQH
ncbi:tRNA1(Val) (adenine(37)-N6)-methyltransferase [Ephemeroptericola cinctiostellae]|uniref:tRNA1(Val) (Adenine(37)-N6)-methyltransferase n=1 Tax=Ephemeroptericola cinctiostellae TaxID=2268024 RepID=A0A345D8C1_9BURK|nr:class I SAM-dependent methyltransferase [Ephemeroptericola cinctiostellae]AXF84609.1 tRNA1(Val) (adenine(37)-N6)-methyltransferase [Ephemeroptericola cinctiostellae]